MIAPLCYKFGMIPKASFLRLLSQMDLNDCGSPTPNLERLRALAGYEIMAVLDNYSNFRDALRDYLVREYQLVVKCNFDGQTWPVMLEVPPPLHKQADEVTEAFETVNVIRRLIGIKGFDIHPCLMIKQS